MFAIRRSVCYNLPVVFSDTFIFIIKGVLSMILQIWQGLILGLIQGLGEFLPISSSGHILLGTQLMGLDSGAAAMKLITVLLHVGTLIPVIIIFWKDWWDILRHLFVRKTFFLLIVASVPALVFKLVAGKIMIGDTALIDYLDSGRFLGLYFLLTAVILLVCELISKKKAKTEVGYGNAAVMGGFQAVAMLGGISRSGSTILGGVISGLDRSAAARFSFLMSAPAILGGLLMEGKDFIDLMQQQGEGALSATVKANLLPVLAGVIVAAIVGYLAIRFFLKVISKRNSFTFFAVYMMLLGCGTLALQYFGVIA